MSIILHSNDPALAEQAQEIATQFGLNYRAAYQASDDELTLLLTADHLALIQSGPKAPGPVYVDFVGGKADHRRKFGGGRGQPIAKAIGLKQGENPSIIDATAGLGRDAFVLATLGSEVTMVEQSPVIAALLSDGLRRANEHDETATICQRMKLVNQDSANYLEQLGHNPEECPDVVYLDPMYPHREKSALVKKEMRLFQLLLGSDNNNEALLAAALKCSRKRVVVKRPKGAEALEGPAPTMAISSKNTRYDVYVIAAMGAR